jgi:hypothetical protein
MAVNTGGGRIDYSPQKILPDEEDFPEHWRRLYRKLNSLANSGSKAVEEGSTGALTQGIAGNEFRRGVALFTRYLDTEIQGEGNPKLHIEDNLVRDTLEACIEDRSNTGGIAYNSSMFNELKEDIPFMREELGEDYPIVRFKQGFPSGVEVSVSEKSLTYEFLNSELNKLISEAREALPLPRKVALMEKADTEKQLRHQMGGFLAATTLFLEVSELTWKEIQNHEQELEKEVSKQETVLDQFEQELDTQETGILIEALEDVEEELVQMAEDLGNEAFIDGLGKGIHDFDESLQNFLKDNPGLKRILEDSPDLSDGFIEQVRKGLQKERYYNLSDNLTEAFEQDIYDLGQTGFRGLAEYLSSRYTGFEPEEDWKKLGYTLALYAATDILHQAVERNSKNQDVSDSQVEKKKERQRKLLKREIGRIDRQATGYFYDQHIFLYFRYAKILYRFTDRLSDDYVEIQAGAQKGLEKFLEPYSPNSHMHHANIKPDSKSDKAFRKGMEIAGLEKEDMSAKVEPGITSEDLWEAVRKSEEVRQFIQDNADFRDSTVLKPVTGVFERIEEEREGKGKRFRRGLTAAQYTALKCRKMYKRRYGQVIRKFRKSDRTI